MTSEEKDIYDTGFNDGYSKGYDVGHEEGYEIGEENGLAEGIAQAHAEDYYDELQLEKTKVKDLAKELEDLKDNTITIQQFKAMARQIVDTIEGKTPACSYRKLIYGHMRMDNSWYSKLFPEGQDLTNALCDVEGLGGHDEQVEERP